MPLVEFQCKKHEVFSEVLSPSQEYRASCPICHQEGRRLWSDFNFSVTFNAGYDVAADRNFNSERQRDNWLAEKGWKKKNG